MTGYTNPKLGVALMAIAAALWIIPILVYWENIVPFLIKHRLLTVTLASFFGAIVFGGIVWGITRGTPPARDIAGEIPAKREDAEKSQAPIPVKRGSTFVMRNAESSKMTGNKAIGFSGPPTFEMRNTKDSVMENNIAAATDDEVPTLMVKILDVGYDAGKQELSANLLFKNRDDKERVINGITFTNFPSKPPFRKRDIEHSDSRSFEPVKIAANGEHPLVYKRPTPSRYVDALSGCICLKIDVKSKDSEAIYSVDALVMSVIRDQETGKTVLQKSDINHLFLDKP